MNVSSPEVEVFPPCYDRSLLISSPKIVDLVLWLIKTDVLNTGQDNYKEAR